MTPKQAQRIKGDDDAITAARRMGQYAREALP
jgi:hypothetical protein